MAITAIANPADLSPAYNPLKFIYDSTNKNEAGFKYVFDIYESGTANKIAEYRVLPRITDGYGELDISKLMQGFVDYDLNLSATEDATAPNSFYKYDLKVGEELVTEFDWTANLTQDGSYVNITATHAFVVGDRVVVDGGVANPNLSGLYTVTAINTTVDFTINALWTQVDDATGNGSVRYSDNRKTITRNLATANNQYVYNAALRHLDWVGYSDTIYRLSTNTDKFMTSMPSDNFYITPTQELYFNLCTNSTTTGRIYFENDSGDKAYYNANASGFVFQANVGSTAVPSTVTNGTLPIIKPTTKYYDVWYTTSGNVQHSIKYRIYIDNRCAIEDYQILFVDRLGSICSFAFQLRAYESGAITRDTYNQDIQGSVTSVVWGYTSTEFGQKTFSVSAERSLQLNTNWMTEEMAEYFEELLTSPLTILKNGSTYQPVIVTDSSYEIEKQRNNNLIKKTITVKYANQDIVNG